MSPSIAGEENVRFPSLPVVQFSVMWRILIIHLLQAQAHKESSPEQNELTLFCSVPGLLNGLLSMEKHNGTV